MKILVMHDKAYKQLEDLFNTLLNKGNLIQVESEKLHNLLCYIWHNTEHYNERDLNYEGE